VLVLPVSGAKIRFPEKNFFEKIGARLGRFFIGI